MKLLFELHAALRLVALALLFTLASACREPLLHNSQGTLELAPARLDFEPVMTGGAANLGFKLRNSGRSTLPLVWEPTKGPFEVVEPPQGAAAGSTSVRVFFRPTSAGVFSHTLIVHSGEQLLSLELSGSAVDPPACPRPAACQKLTFDRVQGFCVATVLPDGAACDPHSVCLQEARCQSGRCVGVEKKCDDGNACTVDLCNALSGCEHLPAPPCPGDGKCQVGVCDPSSGCGLAPASDGAYCGPARTCDLADVCISGNCVKRDPPDGFVCAQASPCQAEGRCQASVCARPAPSLLLPNWSFDAKTAAEPDPLHDLLLESDGAVSLAGFFAAPVARANTSGALRLPSAARRCILWNSRLVCADYPGSSSGRVSAVDPLSGQTHWSFDLPAARPDWVALAAPGRIFMARLASLGSDRLAALFEAYPAGQPTGTLCRLYFLVVLDGAGAVVSATQVTDPLIDVCNHPHPFGVAADVVGNLFLAFSPSDLGIAPLKAHAPTLLVSYSRDGVLRWKRGEGIRGGELAVAQGVLYPEHGGTAFDTTTGAVRRTLPAGAVFGRPVISADRLVPSPIPGGDRLELLSTSLGQSSASFLLPAGESFISGEVRLAAFKSEPVALAFIERGGHPWLAALGTRFGTEEWSCPLGTGLSGDPQLFEVAPGTLAMMEGSDQCSACDPPFAQSQAIFHTYLLPGIEAPFAPWTGTWGGPGHDHREDALVARPPGP